MMHIPTLRRSLIVAIACAFLISGCSRSPIAPTSSIPTFVTAAPIPTNTEAATAEATIQVAATNTVKVSTSEPAVTNTTEATRPADTATAESATVTVAPTEPAATTIAATEVISPTALPADAAVSAITIEGLQFSPKPLTVDVGTTVQWTNKDVAMHTVTSGFPGEPNGTFDAGVLKENEQFSFTFDTAGEFKFYCRIHPFMTGTVIVKAP